MPSAHSQDRSSPSDISEGGGKNDDHWVEKSVKELQNLVTEAAKRSSTLSESDGKAQSALTFSKRITPDTIQMPPFSFIHDFVTTFGQWVQFPAVGFFSPAELDVSSIDSTKAKTAFLTRTVDLVVVGARTLKETPVDVSPTAIVEGKHQEETAAFLTQFCRLGLHLTSEQKQHVMSSVAEDGGMTDSTSSGQRPEGLFGVMRHSMGDSSNNNNPTNDVAVMVAGVSAEGCSTTQPPRDSDVKSNHSAVSGGGSSNWTVGSVGNQHQHDVEMVFRSLLLSHHLLTPSSRGSRSGSGSSGALKSPGKTSILPEVPHSLASQHELHQQEGDQIPLLKKPPSSLGSSSEEAPQAPGNMMYSLSELEPEAIKPSDHGGDSSSSHDATQASEADLRKAIEGIAQDPVALKDLAIDAVLALRTLALKGKEDAGRTSPRKTKGTFRNVGGPLSSPPATGLGGWSPQTATLSPEGNAHSATTRPPQLAIGESSTSVKPSPRGKGLLKGHGASIRGLPIAPGKAGAKKSFGQLAKMLTQGSFDFSVLSMRGEHPFVGTTERKQNENEDSDSDEEDMPEVNQYLLLEQIGSGATAVVHMGYDTQLEEYRAIKEMRRPLQRSSEMQVIQSEIDTMRQLRHKNLVTLYEVIDDPVKKRLYLVMQYIEKGTLVHYDVPDKSHSTPIHPAEFVYYAKQLTAGLSYLHRHGIHHRDIKPENVLHGKDGQVYLADFGVSETLKDRTRELGAPQSNQEAADAEEEQRLRDGSYQIPEAERRSSMLSVTSDRTDRSLGGAVPAPHSLPFAKGTPAFFPPEVMDGRPDRVVTGDSHDVWALGLTFYVLLVGHLPWIPSQGGNRKESSVGTTPLESFRDTPQAEASSASTPNKEGSAVGASGPGESSVLTQPGPSSEVQIVSVQDVPSAIDVMSIPPTPTASSGSQTPNNRVQASGGGGAARALPVDVTAIGHLGWRDYRHEVLHGEVMYPPTLPLAWKHIIEGMLKKSPSARWNLDKVRKEVRKLGPSQMTTLVKDALWGNSFSTTATGEGPHHRAVNEVYANRAAEAAAASGASKRTSSTSSADGGLLSPGVGSVDLTAQESAFIDSDVEDEPGFQEGNKEARLAVDSKRPRRLSATKEPEGTGDDDVGTVKPGGGGI